MSDTATDTAPATADTEPDGDAQTTQATDTQDTTTQTPDTGDAASTDGTRAPIDDGTQASDFSVPDEYKDKPWLARYNFKSSEDVFKALDGAQELIGKKTITPIDYSTASPEEIAAHHSSLAPENISDYGFSEDADPAMSDAVGSIFQKYGIDKYQGKGLAADIREITAKAVKEKAEADTSEEAYMKMMEESFGQDGADYKTTVGIIEKSLKEHAKSDDDKKIFDKMDNSHRAAVDRTIHSITKSYEDRIKAILEEHGVTESGAQVEGDKGVNTGVDVNEVRAELRDKLTEISQRSHTSEEVQVLKNKLAATYK